jgi:hypothetical protein
VHLRELLVIEILKQCPQLASFEAALDHHCLERPFCHFISVLKVKVTHLLEQMFFGLLKSLPDLCASHCHNFLEGLNDVVLESIAKSTPFELDVVEAKIPSEAEVGTVSQVTELSREVIEALSPHLGKDTCLRTGSVAEITCIELQSHDCFRLFKFIIVLEPQTGAIHICYQNWALRKFRQFRNKFC